MNKRKQALIGLGAPVVLVAAAALLALPGCGPKQHTVS